VKLVRHVTNRPGHDRHYALDPTFLPTNVSWRPRQDFEAALPALVRWYLLHKDWINSIRTSAYRQYYELQYADR
jgi:dTDP-glucose 4,6-dehydratase